MRQKGPDTAGQNKHRGSLILMALLLCLLTACGGDRAALPEDAASPPQQSAQPAGAESGLIPEASGQPTEDPEGEYASSGLVTYDEYYTTPEDVAEYLDTYGELPPNFLTKQEARELGWDSAEGNLRDVAEGMSIGGDRFGNREGLLPEEQGRTWYECDVNYDGGFRGGERIVWSSDGMIYYTDDHYQSFTRLY